MTDGLDRLKVLINSATPIVVMETSEEMRAVNLVRAACSELNMATFEWSIADGLLRSGSAVDGSKASQTHADALTTVWNQNSRNVKTALTPGGAEADRLVRTMMSSMGPDAAAAVS